VRSPAEIGFRLKQETGNLRLWLLGSPQSSQVPADAESPLAGLPDPAPIAERLKGSPFAGQVEQLANQILGHRFPLLATTVETGGEMDWRKDYHHGHTSPLSYFRLIPYLDFSRVGDYRLIWELNRHQHLVLLAQAFRLTGRSEFVGAIQRQLEHWTAANPFLLGINWTSSLEAAFRALSWIWTYHLAGHELQPPARRLLLAGLHAHGCYLERNLSFYHASNTHLLGEALALEALGRLFPALPRAARWLQIGRPIVDRQMASQVRDDGSHFEQASFYHVYALDMFLFHRVLGGGAQPAFREKLERMADFLAALMGPQRRLPLLGDDDGGRLFHPYGRQDEFGRATLTTCGLLLDRPDWIGEPVAAAEQAAWWLGPRALDAAPGPQQPAGASRWFPQAGIAVLTAPGLHVVVDAGAFGVGTGGHSHSDTLSLVVRLGREEILVDSGTYTYNRSIRERNWFRGSAAHNTVRVDERDQATCVNPFRWTDTPVVRLLRKRTAPDHDLVEAECRYGDIVHRRAIVLLKPALLIVRDEVSGPPGEHLLEQFWHPGEPVRPAGPGCFGIGNRSLLVTPASEQVEASEGGEHGWRSPGLGARNPAPVIRVVRRSTLPACFWTVLDCAPETRDSSLRLMDPGHQAGCEYRNGSRRLVAAIGEDRELQWRFV